MLILPAIHRLLLCEGFYFDTHSISKPGVAFVSVVLTHAHVVGAIQVAFIHMELLHLLIVSNMWVTVIRKE